MENRNYKVKREDIYVGELIRTDRDSIYRYSEDDFFDYKKGQLYTSCWETYRSMLFVLTEEKLCEDLLYSSSHYPVLNITDIDIYLNSTSPKIEIVKEAYNLSLLLEYFQFSEELTFEDIIRIRKTFFTGRFGMDHCELFGMKEFIPASFQPRKKGVLVTDKKQIYELYKKSVVLGSERQFGSVSSSILPHEFMDILDDRGREYGVKDPFAPSQKEQNVKRLKKI